MFQAMGMRCSCSGCSALEPIGQLLDCARCHLDTELGFHPSNSDPDGKMCM